MDRSLTVLLVEDDAAECTRFGDYVDRLDDVHMVAITNHAKQALEHVVDHQPDAIILDLELHHGGGDGLSFLAALKRIALPYTPYILITTNNIHAITHEQARRMGAAFIMVKQQADYSVESVIDFLRNAKAVIQDSRQKIAPAPELSDDKQKRLLTKITAEIDRIGISPKLIGRNYLIEYIFMQIEGSSDSPVADISQKYGKTEASVKFAMQNAINVTWRSGDIEELQRHYTARVNPDKGVPTVMEFVFYYRDRIVMTQQKQTLFKTLEKTR